MPDHHNLLPDPMGADDAANASGPTDRLIANGRIAPAANGWQWFVQAWRLFAAQPLSWLGVFVLALVLVSVLSALPVVSLLTAVAGPFLTAGFGSCARTVSRGGRFGINQLFDGLRVRPGQLAIVGLIYIGILVAIMLIFAAMIGASGMSALTEGDMAQREEAARQLFSTMGLGFLLIFLVLVSLFSTVIFAPFLVQEHQMSATQAIMMSAKGSLKNIPAGLVWIISYTALGILASVPIALGWIILLPVAVLTQYTAYRDIFVDSSA